MSYLTSLAVTAVVAGAAYSTDGFQLASLAPQNPPVRTVSEMSQAQLPADMFSCNQAKTMLQSKGYRDITVLDCAGSQYRFEARYRGEDFVVIFASFSGGMVAIERPADTGLASNQGMPGLSGQ